MIVTAEDERVTHIADRRSAVGGTPGKLSDAASVLVL
jgi:hypothetical protein